MRQLKQPFLLIALTIALSGCMGTAFIKDSEYHLRRQKVKGTQKIDNQALAELYRQQTNRRLFWLFMPYIYMYEWGYRSFDTEKTEQQKQETIEKFDRRIAEAKNEDKADRLNTRKRKKVTRIDKKLEDGNMFMRWGEPVSVLDSFNIITTTEQIDNYLKAHGFLEREVSYQVKFRNKKARVNYQVKEGPAYVIDTVTVKTTDDNIYRIISENTRESLLKQKSRYNQTNLRLERERLSVLLRNHGYFDFSTQYINFTIYDTLSEKRLPVEIIINNPRNGPHKVYTVDSVVFHGGLAVRDGSNAAQYNRKNYLFGHRKFSERILDQRIFINSGQNYNYEATLETQRQLLNLDNFKFINIYYDSTGGNFIANIHASPLDKYQTNNEVGLGIIVSEGFPSPFYNFSLKNRNVFGSLENMELNARIGIEGIPSATDVSRIYRGTEAGGNFSLTIPQFALPLGTETKRRLGNINPKTRVLIGATFSSRPEYQRNTFNTSLMYSWQKGLRRQYNFTLVDLNLINSRFDSTSRVSREFLARLREFADAGNKLINSFEPSLINSMAFSTTYDYGLYGQYLRKASRLKLFVENGGTLFDLSNVQFLSYLQHYKFYRVFVEHKGFRPLPQKSSFAFRTFLGIANAYGGTEALPYEKYFFAGGSNGIRAWSPRRLGPGSYRMIKTLEDGEEVFDDRFEQPAELLFEATAELRKKLVGFLEGAVFLDVGNSWTLRTDMSPEDGSVLRPGAEFRYNRFYKEIAVGTGLGARFDFSFLIIRFDLGLKLYDPARDPGSRFILSEKFNAPPFHKTKNYTWNLGIGYPF